MNAKLLSSRCIMTPFRNGLFFSFFKSWLSISYEETQDLGISRKLRKLKYKSQEHISKTIW